MTDQIERKAALEAIHRLAPKPPRHQTSCPATKAYWEAVDDCISNVKDLPAANAWTPASEPPDDSRKVWEVILHAPQTFEEHPGLAFCYGNEWRDGATGEAIPDAVCSTELPKPPEGG